MDSSRLPGVNPLDAGLSPSRLNELHRTVQGHIDRGCLAGALTLIARDGRIADLHLYGYHELEGKRPMQRDTLFAVASLTKIVTATAVLQLIETGDLHLDDPVSRYLPELNHMQVWAKDPMDPTRTVEAQPITLRHLLTHRSGLASTATASPALRRVYHRILHLNPHSFSDYLPQLAQLPLEEQPGVRYIYGVNFEVLGALVEAVSGRAFGSYLHERIFQPLGMSDSFFQVPPEKQHRIAQCYMRRGKARLTRFPIEADDYALGGPGCPSGGGGLVMTADDLAKFAQMLLNQGELNGARILAPASVQLMTEDHLTNPKEETPAECPFASHGLGVGLRLRNAPEPSTKQFGWTGAPTTFCCVDQIARTVAIFFAQHLPWNDDHLFEKFSEGFYRTLHR